MPTVSAPPVSDSSLRNQAATGHKERILPEDMAAEPDHVARYLFASHFAPGQAVLDLCCGIGYGSNILSGVGAKSVLGVDIDGETVAAAADYFSRPNLEFRRADALQPCDFSPVGVAICLEGLEHVQRPEAILDNIAGCLEGDGVAVVSTPNGGAHAGGHSGNPYHVHEYRLDEFRKLLAPYFGRVEIFFQWSSGDPLDFRWNPRSIARAMTPIPVKHFLHSTFKRRSGVLQAASAESAVSPAVGAVSLYTWRPYPLAYLSLFPGLWHAQPAIWMAVCRQPRKP